MWISIHDPAKGATGSVLRCLTCRKDFNPRSREGSDTNDSGIRATSSKFQSTLPRRERRFTEEEARAIVAISIHAPAKGATFFISTSSLLWDRFQSTLPRRERPKAEKVPLPPIPISIHAPAKGATNGTFITIKTATYFNPRSREGSDSKTPL